MQIKICSRATIYVVLIAILIPAAVLVNRPISITPNYEKIFTKLYEQGTYGYSDNSSDYIALVQQYLLDPNVRRIVALGCGDPYMLRNIVIPANKTYICYDVVSEIIAANNDEFSQDNIQFIYIETLRDFVSLKTSGDLLIVKDFLQYWPNTEIKHFLLKTCRKFKYALFTNIYVKNPVNLNNEISAGQYRVVDLLVKPFNLRRASIVLEYEIAQTHEQKRVILKIT